MNKQVDMQAFVGRDFDCEFKDSVGCWDNIYQLFKVDHSGPDFKRYYYSDDSYHWFDVRPRLNKPQVLDGWSWVPDGLVWQIDCYPRSGIDRLMIRTDTVSSYDLRVWSNHFVIIHASCIGVEPEYEAWGKERGMRVIAL